MASCPIWRQILWFCLRNGLWYGESGSKGCAGLELTDELVYSTTGTGDVIDETIVTVGTLEKISRTTEAFDKDSIEAIVAKGVFTSSNSEKENGESKAQAAVPGSPARQVPAPTAGNGTSVPSPALSTTQGGRGNMQQPPMPYSYPHPAYGPPMGQGMPPPQPNMMYPGSIPPGMMGRGGPMPVPPPGHPAFGQMPYPFGPGPMGPPPPGMMMGVPPPGMMMERGGGPMAAPPGHGAPPPPGYMQPLPLSDKDQCQINNHQHPAHPVQVVLSLLQGRKSGPAEFLSLEFSRSSTLYYVAYCENWSL